MLYTQYNLLNAIIKGVAIYEYETQAVIKVTYPLRCHSAEGTIYELFFQSIFITLVKTFREFQTLNQFIHIVMVIRCSCGAVVDHRVDDGRQEGVCACVCCVILSDTADEDGQGKEVNSLCALSHTYEITV